MSFQDAKTFIEIPILIIIFHPIAFSLLLHMSSHLPVKDYIKYRNVANNRYWPTSSHVNFFCIKGKLKDLNDTS